MWNRVRRVQNVPWQVMEESTLILNSQESKAHELNSSGTLIWDAIADWKSLDQLVTAVCESYEVDYEVARQDILNLIEELKNKSLVEWQL